MSTFQTITIRSPVSPRWLSLWQTRTHFTETSFIAFHQVTFSFQVHFSSSEQLEVIENAFGKERIQRKSDNLNFNHSRKHFLMWSYQANHSIKLTFLPHKRHGIYCTDAQDPLYSFRLNTLVEIRLRCQRRWVLPQQESHILKNISQKSTTTQKNHISGGNACKSWFHLFIKFCFDYVCLVHHPFSAHYPTQEAVLLSHLTHLAIRAFEKKVWYKYIFN